MCGLCRMQIGPDGVWKPGFSLREQAWPVIYQIIACGHQISCLQNVWCLAVLNFSVLDDAVIIAVVAADWFAVAAPPMQPLTLNDWAWRSTQL